MARVQTLLLLVPIVIGVTLRLGDVTSTSIQNLDEGGYLMEAKKLLRAGQAAWIGLGMMRGNVRAGFLDPTSDQKACLAGVVSDGWELSYGKPVHSWAVAVGLAICGPLPWVGNAVSALAGCLTLFVLFLWGWRIGGARYGLLAAGFLATEYMHLHYSRTTFPEAITVLFYVAGLYQVDRLLRGQGGAWRGCLAGAMLGLCFLASYRALPILVVSVLVLQVAHRASAGPVMIVGFVLPLFLIEVVYFGLFQLSAAFGVFLVRVGPTTSIVRQLLFGGASENKLLQGSLTYPLDVLVPVSGWVTVLLVAGGAVLAWKVGGRRRRLVGLLVPTLLLWCLVSTQQARFLSLGLPVLALLAAELLEAVLARLDRGPAWAPVAGALGVVVLFGCQADRGRRRLPPRSGYDEACAWVADRRPSKVLCTNPSIAGYFLGRTLVDEEFTDEKLDPGLLRARGYSHVILCAQGEVGPFRDSLRIEEERLRRHVTPVTFENPGALHPFFRLDNQIWSEETLIIDGRLAEIRVYEVREGLR